MHGEHDVVKAWYDFHDGQVQPVTFNKWNVEAFRSRVDAHREAQIDKRTVIREFAGNRMDGIIIRTRMLKLGEIY